MSDRQLYLIIIVLLNAAINVMHGLAHFASQVIPGLLDSLFIGLVIGAAPLIGLLIVCKWSQRAGGLLLLISLLASFVYGLYHHFLVSGADNALTMPEGGLSALFLITALLLLATEIVGSWIVATLVLRRAAITL